jgi:hypothetical protein
MILPAFLLEFEDVALHPYEASKPALNFIPLAASSLCAAWPHYAFGG